MAGTNIDGFRLYKKTDEGDEFIAEIAKTARSKEFMRTMATGMYGISAYKIVADVIDPSKKTMLESIKRYFTVNPFYRIIIKDTIIESETVTVKWENETNVNYFDGYQIYRINTDGDEVTYDLVDTIESDEVSEYVFMRDDDTTYNYVISPKTYDGFHDADSSYTEVLFVVIPPVTLLDPIDAVTYTACWEYEGDDEPEPSDLPDHWTEFYVWNFENDGSITDRTHEFEFKVSGRNTANPDDIMVAVKLKNGGMQLYDMPTHGGNNKIMTIPVHLEDTVRVYSPTAVPLMFGENPSYSTAGYRVNITKFDKGWTSMTAAFYGLGNLYEITTWEGVENITNATSAFQSSGVVKLPHRADDSYTFANFVQLENAGQMFLACQNLSTDYNIVFDGLEHVTNFNAMFNGCNYGNTAQVYNVDFSGISTTANVSSMFSGGTYINVLNFGTIGINIKNMASTYSKNFSYITNNLSQISSWNGIEHFSGLSSVFNAQYSLGDIPTSWEGFAINNAYSWFMNCTALSEIPSSWEGAGSLIIADSMFNGCTMVRAIPNSWRGLNNIHSMDSMFAYCPLSSGGNDDINVLGNVYASGSLFLNCNESEFLNDNKVAEYMKVLVGSTYNWCKIANATETVDDISYIDYGNFNGSGFGYIYEHRHKISLNDAIPLVKNAAAQKLGISTDDIPYCGNNRYTFNGSSKYSSGRAPYSWNVVSFNTGNMASGSDGIPISNPNTGSYWYVSCRNGEQIRVNDLKNRPECFSEMTVLLSDTVNDSGDIDTYYLY